MSDIKISLDTSGPKGEISVVRVDGVIDTMTATDLEKVMNSLMERRRYNIVVDLGGVDYISSAGWGIFISNIREIRQNAGDIKLARMIPNVYEIFELLEFDSILKAFESVEKAKSDFDGLKKQPVAENSSVAALEKAPETQPSLDDPAPAAPTMPESKPQGKKGPDTRPVPGDPHDIVLEMIAIDPFLSIGEIKREIAKKHNSRKIGWWRIWNILRNEKLLSKKSRFRRARIKTGNEK